MIEEEKIPAEKKQVRMRKCATCGKEKPATEMKITMDHRPMHIYVCDTRCAINFYK